MFKLILLMSITTHIRANDCSSTYYEALTKEGPSLPPDEIISSHKVKENAVGIECYFLCKAEPRCVGFNYRKTAGNFENCQLTNVTKMRNGTKKEDWILLLDVEATKKEQERKGKNNNGNSVKRSCDAFYKSGENTTGVYTIEPDGQGAFQVRCDMTTTPGFAWTIFQRRVDGSEDFYRKWSDYKNGFGNLTGEFWLGLDKIHRLTASGGHVLRVDLESFENEKRHATYGNFSVGNESKGYILSIGQYTGDAGDSLSFHNGMKFSTRDVDNAIQQRCAQLYEGAWWYKNCHQSNLNGKYLAGNHDSYANGVNWFTYKNFNYSMKTSEMKIR